MHSWVEWVLIPFLTTEERPENYEEVKRIADEGAAALEKVNMRKYQVNFVKQ